MYGELYVLITAFLRGFSNIPTKKGLQTSNPNTSAFIYLIINTVLLWYMVFVLYPGEQLNTNGLVYFVAAGICAPAVARLFKDTGLKRLGVALSTPVISTNSLFSVTMATLFLGEEITVYIIAGAILIFIGVNVITWQKVNRVEWRKKDLVFPLIAAFFFASSTNLRKIGLDINGLPLLGAAFTSTTSLGVLLISLLVARVRNSEDWTLNLNRESLKYFTIAGLTSSVAFMFYFTALSMSTIVSIQPIAGTSPLWAIFFSYIFFRDTEVLTSRTILGALVIVAGVALIFL